MVSGANAQFEVLDRYDEVAPFLPAVVQAADAHRNALGFFAASVFEDFARRDRLFVIVRKTGTERNYVGHLLFRPQFPRAHVMQMLVLQEFRRHGLAAKLIDHFKAQLTQQGFISIYARVAEDLSDSNMFWQRQGFYVQRIEKGGNTRNRQILVRCHELASPQLFPTSGIDASNPLGLVNSTADTLPLFLLDLNVLFDVAPRRLRHEDAALLFQAERSNFCRLAISTEIREELQRTAHAGRTDPMEAYIAIYPAFPFIEGTEAEPLLKRLATIIFPSRAKDNKLTANDRSDLRHVASAIQNNLSGLITNDGAILEAAAAIEKEFGIEILSSAAFTLNDTGSGVNKSFATPEDSALALREVEKTDEVAVRAFLSKLGFSGQDIAVGWLPIDTKGRIAMSCGVWSKDTLVAYSTWASKGKAGAITLRIAVDEASPQALSAARVLLMHFLDGRIHQGPQNISLELPANQSNVREVASSFGFHGTPDKQCLTKLALGGVVTENSWATVQSDLLTRVELKLPAAVPQYRHADQQLQIFTPSGNQTHVSLDTLETLLSPALLCLPGRPAVLTPIRRNFAEELLGSSPQGSLLPRSTASSFYDRHYLSDPKTLRHFKRGTLILFYESTKNGGRAAVVAIARVRESYLRPADANVRDLEHSVLTQENLDRIGKSTMKTVTVFDNIFLLPRVVSLKSLKKLGCGEPNQLITTRPLTGEQFEEILNEALKRE